MTLQEAPARRGRPGYDRDGMLAVAVALFIERGYDATSVADLAERLGLSKSALYHHFSSKEEVLAVALDRALDPLEAVLDQPGARSGKPVARVEHVMRAAVVVLVERLDVVTLLLRVRGNSDTERTAIDRRREFDHRVTTLVREAQDAGELRADVDPAVATRLVFGMINSLTEWYRPNGELDALTLADDILRIALDGLGTGPGGGPRPTED